MISKGLLYKCISIYPVNIITNLGRLVNQAHHFCGKAQFFSLLFVTFSQQAKKAPFLLYPKKRLPVLFFRLLLKSHIVNFFNFLPCISHKKDAAKSFRGIFLRYDCPCGQAMSYEVLRTVMIGFAKLLCSGTRRRISYGKEVGRAKIPKIDPMPQDFGAISFSHRTQCRRILERFCLTVTRSRISYGEGDGRVKAPFYHAQHSMPQDFGADLLERHPPPYFIRQAGQVGRRCPFHPTRHSVPQDFGAILLDRYPKPYFIRRAETGE